MKFTVRLRQLFSSPFKPKPCRVAESKWIGLATPKRRSSSRAQSRLIDELVYETTRLFRVNVSIVISKPIWSKIWPRRTVLTQFLTAFHPYNCSYHWTTLIGKMTAIGVPTYKHDNPKEVFVPSYSYRYPAGRRVQLAAVKEGIFHPRLPTIRQLDRDRTLHKLTDEHCRTSLPVEVLAPKSKLATHASSHFHVNAFINIHT